ncbi:MAG TPA: SGNH/GDSL hydrolase family protein [Gemmatimonadaceae bacterium]|nr:SGNH/GDSL hydrolase family protein [Gemmatimonadaceae bacterium]
MSRNRLLPLAALAFVAACNDDPDVIAPPAGSGALLERYVALGNSITAGFQSGGISNTTQQQSYAALLAAQAGTRYSYARLAGNGCPPPIVNFLTGEGEGGVPAAQRGATCAFRDPATTTGPLNNVGVPNAYAVDPTSTNTVSSNALTQFILGGKTQARRALDADPTFVTLWFGNNDVLSPALTGLIAPTAGVTQGLTPVANFTASIDALIDQLEAGAPSLRGGVAIGVVNTTNIPALFSANTLFDDPVFQAQFRAATGGDPANPATLTVLANCDNSTSLVSVAIIPQIRLYRANPAAAGAHPPLISCGVTAAAPAPVGDIFILDATEQTAIANATTAYNAAISARAAQAGFLYVDPNPLLAQFRANGQIPAVPNFTSATAPFGALISLDGYHPSAAAHRIIANALIQAINAGYGQSIPALP